MAKQRVEKLIKINGELPVDLWSISIDLITLKPIGPVNIMKKGLSMRNIDSYEFYTTRTKKEMLSNGYWTYRKPEKLILLALTRTDCLVGLHTEVDRLATNIETNIKSLKNFAGTVI